MLPPVRAALNSNADHSGLAPQVTGRVRIDNAQALALPDDGGAMPLSGRSLDLVSLSGQLKLAQGSSIFAETIGRLLKLPRQENEPLADYAARLTQAVQALKRAERAALERMLNQLVKGISVRLLPEILKDPAGPTAARIALHMETASSSERDLVAKAVISSYRQNASTEHQSSVVAARGAQTALTQQAAGTPAAAATPQTARGQAQGTTATLEARLPGADATQAGYSAAAAGGAPQAQGETSTHRPLTPGSAAQLPASERGSASPALPRADSAASAGDAPGAEASPAATEEQNARAAATQGRSAPGAEAARLALPGAGPGGQAPPVETAGKNGHPADVKGKEEAARPARLSRETLKQELLMAARQSATARADKPIADLLGWLASLFAEPEIPQQAQTATRLSAQTGLPMGAEAEQPATASEEGQTETGMSGATSASAEKAIVKAEPNAAGARAAPASAGQMPGESAEQQLATGMAAAFVTTIREGIPHPYISYPPAEDAPERQERRARAIAEIGDEEEDGHAQDHGFHGEEQPDDEADREAPQDDRPTEDAFAGESDEGRPNDLYWRMAGWR